VRKNRNPSGLEEAESRKEQLIRWMLEAVASKRLCEVNLKRRLLRSPGCVYLLDLRDHEVRGYALRSA
jgi:DNA-binding TFAR19-related protein (PDSD5 family)